MKEKLLVCHSSRVIQKEAGELKSNCAHQTWKDSGTKNRLLIKQNNQREQILTFFANLDVLVLEQVCQKREREEHRCVNLPLLFHLN